MAKRFKKLTKADQDRLQTMKIVLAPDEERKSLDLEPFIDRVLEIIGHPEALVTDESIVWDFYPLEKDKRYLKSLSKKLGVPVDSHRETIVSLAKKLKEIAQ